MAAQIPHSDTCEPPCFCAVVAAAGAGTRMGTAGRKPFLGLAGEPIVFHALRRLKRSRGCREIVLVLRPDEIGPLPPEFSRRLAEEFAVTKIAAGGATRQESVWSGLQLVDEGIDLVLIHDAVRPLVDTEVVERVAIEAAAGGAAVAAIPCQATVKEVAEGRTISCTHPREAIWLAQTPQGFRKDIILRAYRQARQDGFLGTDDAQLVERLGGEVTVVRDSPDNIKITTPHDLVIAEALLRWKNSQASP